MGMFLGFVTLAITLVTDALVIRMGHGKSQAQAGVGALKVKGALVAVITIIGFYFTMVNLTNPNFP